MSSLTGKIAVVTGASSGIGHAIAEALLERGARVFGLCRKIGKIPEEAIPVSCDLRNPHRIAHAFEILQQATPTVDILVNNAGVAYLSSLLEGPVEEWDEMWEVNVRAVALCTRHAVNMMPPGGGRIVNVSTLSGHRVPPTGGFYAPTNSDRIGFPAICLETPVHAGDKRGMNRSRSKFGGLILLERDIDLDALQFLRPQANSFPRASARQVAAVNPEFSGCAGRAGRRVDEVDVGSIACAQPIRVMGSS